MLDCGCGAGDNARLLAQQACSVTGITISSEEAVVAAQYCKSVLIADLEVGLPQLAGELYDIVIASHVLEHLRHPERILSDIRKVLAPEGLLIVALPNVLNYRDRLNFAVGRFDYTDTGIMDQTHVRFYTYKSGRQLLENNGFHVVYTSASGAFPLWKIRKLLPPSVVEGLNQIACRASPGLFAIQSLYVAKVA